MGKLCVQFVFVLCAPYLRALGYFYAKHYLTLSPFFSIQVLSGVLRLSRELFLDKLISFFASLPRIYFCKFRLFCIYFLFVHVIDLVFSNNVYGRVLFLLQSESSVPLRIFSNNTVVLAESVQKLLRRLDKSYFPRIGLYVYYKHAGGVNA